MAAGSSNHEEDEWEYEYSTTETEVFYVDLDLSSANGVIKSINAGDRKTLKGHGKSAKGDSTSKAPARLELDEAGDDDNGNDDAADEERENGDNQDANSPSQAQSPQEPGLLDEDYTGRMQVLDFDSTNPIVSFNGQLYSCTWHDMLGTSMFITKHQEAPFHEPEISTEDYDLIGSSHIKLVGHRARIVPKAGSKKRRRDEGEEVAEDTGPTGGSRHAVPTGKSLGSIKRTNPRTNIEIKQQANFLEKLMEVKKTRGESDTVRTFVDRRTISADVRQARKAKMTAAVNVNANAREKQVTKEQRLRREIQDLNKRVVKGDNDALERLQEIYADMEEVEDDEDEIFIGDSSAPVLTNNRVSTDDVDSDAGHPRVPAGGGRVQRPPTSPE